MTWRDEVSRDPADYHPSDHAFIRARERGIHEDLIGQAIREGHLQEAKGGYPSVRFILEAGLSEPVGIVADADTGQITTVFWNRAYGHPELETDVDAPTIQGRVGRGP